MRHSAKFGAAAVILFALSGCTYISDINDQRVTETRTLTAEHIDNSSVYVQTANGAIDIAADDDVDEVVITAHITATADTEVEAAKRLAETKIIVERDSANQLKIYPVWPDNQRRTNEGAGFEIRLLNASSLTLDTSNGAVTVQSLSGRLAIDTSNGKVELREHSGDAAIETSNGAIVVHNHNGKLNADTSNGAIKIVNHRGSLDADTSNGGIDVSLAGDQVGPIVLDTSNGSIRVSVGPSFGGTVIFDTSNGGISISDPAGMIETRSIDDGDGRIVLKNAGGASVIDTSNAGITFEIRESDRITAAE